MRLLGLDALQLTLVSGALCAIVLLLYLLRRPRRVIETPALFLWDAVEPDRRRATALFRRLRRALSILLALAITLLLALALADPERVAGRGRTLLIVIDRSGSMSARDFSPSRLEHAKTRARELVRALSAGDRAQVATALDTVTPLTAMTGSQEELLAAIERVAPSDGAARLDAVVSYATDVLAHTQGELVLLSDGGFVDPQNASPLQGATFAVAFECLGESGRNVAITRFAVRRYPLDKRHQESLVAVRNFGPRTERVTLRVQAAETTLALERFTLGAGERRDLVLTELPASAELLSATLTLADGADPLESDDRAAAAVPPRKRARVLVVGEGNRYLEAALLLDEYLDVFERLTADGAPTPPHDVVIFDGTSAYPSSGKPALYLGRSERAALPYPLERQGEVARPFFEALEREHPLVRGLALGDVNIARATLVRPAANDVVIGGSSRAPLLVEGVRDGVPFIALPFDLSESDLALRPAFPLLVLRAIDRLYGEQERNPATREAGIAFILPVPKGTGEVSLVAADGTRFASSGSGLERRALLEHAGVYRLDPPLPFVSRVVVQAAAEAEGAIAPQRALVPSRRPPTSRRVEARMEGRLLSLLLALTLGLALFEWLSFHRRWTV